MLNTLKQRVLAFLNNEDGPTAVEYAVMIMLIFLAVITLVQVIGQTTSDSIGNSEQAIDEAINEAWSN